jgi:hypothetical protein
VIDVQLTVGRWHDLDSWRWNHRLATNHATIPV